MLLLFLLEDWADLVPLMLTIIMDIRATSRRKMDHGTTSDQCQLSLRITEESTGEDLWICKFGNSWPWFTSWPFPWLLASVAGSPPQKLLKAIEWKCREERYWLIILIFYCDYESLTWINLMQYARIDSCFILLIRIECIATSLIHFYSTHSCHLSPQSCCKSIHGIKT